MSSWRSSSWSEKVINTGKDLEMATNGTDIAAELSQILGPLDRIQARKRVVEKPEQPEPAEDFALAPLVNKIAYGIARGLVVALKDLEDHIASETRKVSDTVDRRLDILNTTLQDLSNFAGAQRATNTAVEGQLQNLTQRIDTSVTAQQEVNARQA